MLLPALKYGVSASQVFYEVRNLARKMEDELDLSFPLYISISFEHPHDV